jgi:hypothetical protein
MITYKKGKVIKNRNIKRNTKRKVIKNRNIKRNGGSDQINEEENTKVEEEFSPENIHKKFSKELKVLYVEPKDPEKSSLKFTDILIMPVNKHVFDPNNIEEMLRYLKSGKTRKVKTGKVRFDFQSFNNVENQILEEKRKQLEEIKKKIQEKLNTITKLLDILEDENILTKFMSSNEKKIEEKMIKDTGLDIEELNYIKEKLNELSKDIVQGGGPFDFLAPINFLKLDALKTDKEKEQEKEEEFEKIIKEEEKEKKLKNKEEMDKNQEEQQIKEQEEQIIKEANEEMDKMKWKKNKNGNGDYYEETNEIKKQETKKEIKKQEMNEKKIEEEMKKLEEEMKKLNKIIKKLNKIIKIKNNL